MLPAEFEKQPLFEVREPAQLRVPFVFSSPHSGRIYPQEFVEQSILNDYDLRLSEDAFMDILVQDVVQLGACFIGVHFPRAYLDVNRAAYELDPAQFSEKLPDFVTVSLRARSGLGTVPSVVALNKPIYAKKIALQEALTRIENFYFPFHDILEQQLCKIEKEFGFVVLIDCHSMPGYLQFFGHSKQPDIILGDVQGRSCAPELSRIAADLFQEKGYDVVLNQPYSGGFITEHYGKPQFGRHTLQIEVNRNLYMDERLIVLHDGFYGLQRDVMDVAAQLMAIPEDYFSALPYAAE